MDVITRHRLTVLDVDPADLDALPLRDRLDQIYRRFLERVPYENLSNNRAVLRCPDDAEKWPRATDVLLRENSECGLGGTSFSLSYALRDLFRGAGANAHCTLGYNLVTERAHAAVLVYLDGAPWIWDPAILMCDGICVRPGSDLLDPLGRFALQHRHGPTLTMSLTLCDGLTGDARRPERTPDPTWEGSALAALDGTHGTEADRPIYSIVPVPAPPPNFRQAWIASFYKGRAMPLRLARRRGDEIHRYGERPGSIEILRTCGREELPVGKDPVGLLHETFGIREDCLAEWFSRGGRARS